LFISQITVLSFSQPKRCYMTADAPPLSAHAALVVQI